MLGFLRASAVGLLLLLIPAAGRAAVPVGGFLPLVGIGLTDEFDDDFDTFAVPSSQPSGMMLGQGDTAHYDVALLDTGAAVSLLTAQAHFDFKMDGPYPGESDGFSGTETIQIGGATGTLFAEINDPVGLYAGGLQSRTSTSPLVLSNSMLRGQTNSSLITIPEESDLPNVIGLPFASQYATYIRNDLPQILELNGRTVRSPHIEFLPLGSGGQGITRRAPMPLNPGASFLTPPFWFYNIANLDIDNPHENPSQPTVIQGGLFLNVDVANEGEQLNNFQFLFDTGADVTVVSELNAARLGFDVVLDEPEFTVAVVGSGGTNLEVPGFFVDQFTIQALGGNVTLTNVPIIVLDVTNPADPGNVLDGIVGTNLLAGRNVVIDPKPSDGSGGVGPSLYIGDPVTTNHSWTSTAASANWTTASSWNAAGTPDVLWITNVNHVSGGDQTAIVSADSTVWEVNITGNDSNQMTVQVDSGARLTTFSGVNAASSGRLHLNGGTVDAQFVEIRDGTLSGTGLVTTGSGPIPGQVENVSGTVAPGIDGVGTLKIEGRYSNGKNGTLQMEIGGLTADTEHDQLVIDGGVSLAGTLQVDLTGGFNPIAGNSFTLITSTEARGGEFDTLLLPGGIYWDLDYNEFSLVLSMAGEAIPGDFNLDRIVNAADYTVWRDTMGDVDSYNLWRANFGQSLGVSVGAAVPEPATWVLAILAFAVCALSHKRSAAYGLAVC